jgi:hypothetical protein
MLNRCVQVTVSYKSARDAACQPLPYGRTKDTPLRYARHWPPRRRHARLVGTAAAITHPPLP